MVGRFLGGLVAVFVLVATSCQAADIFAGPDLGEAGFLSGKLPTKRNLDLHSVVYVTHDDILIPFLPDFPRRHSASLWSVRRRMTVASGLTIGKEDAGLPAVAITEFKAVHQTQLLDFDLQMRGDVLGKTRIRLADGTFLEQSGLSSLSACTPVGNYFFLVEDQEGHILRRKAFLSYARTPKTLDWNGERCTEIWGENTIVKAAVHYRSAEYFNVSLIGDKLLFIGSEGSFLLTSPELNGPLIDSSLVVVDLEMLNAAARRDDRLSAGARLEANDAALGRALGQIKSK